MRGNNLNVGYKKRGIPLCYASNITDIIPASCQGHRILDRLSSIAILEHNKCNKYTLHVRLDSYNDRMLDKISPSTACFRVHISFKLINEEKVAEETLY